jgi:competence protein ComFB
MIIKNLMEDIVTSMVKEVLKKDSSIPRSEIYEQDIIAYVLNRVPPRYITSERGIIHGKMDSRFHFQQRTDILFLIHEAIDNIKNRRTTIAHSNYDEIIRKNRFLPHIMGEVLEETTFSIIPDVEVTLTLSGKIVSMIDDGWKNPFLTNKSTKGYYHFWPVVAEGELEDKKELILKTVFKHPKFKEKELEFSVRIMDSINLYESRIIPIALLQIKDGADISFLYE